MRIVYLGDEFSATAFSLLGAEPLIAPHDAERIWETVLDARRRSDLLILSTECAARIETRLEALIEAAPRPPLALLPPLDADTPLDDNVLLRARRELGLGPQ